MSEENQQWPQFLAATTSGILAVGAGLHFGWPSPSIPKLLEKDLKFEVNSEEISYVVMIAPFGYLLSGPFSVFIVDRIGRKSSLLLIAIPQILAWLLIAYADGVAILYIARIVAGAAEGALFTVLPMYACEISEPKVRGSLGSIFTVGLILGILLINCYGSFIPIATTAFISISIPLLFLVTFVWMPESPYFFLMKENVEDAKRSLQALRRIQNVETELTILTSDVQRQISESGTLKEVFTIYTNRKAFLILVGVRTLQQFSGYSAFSFYTQVIFKNVKDHLSPAAYSIIYNASHLIFVCLGLFCVEKFGRRPLLIWSTAGSGLCLFVTAFYFYFLCNNYNMYSFSWIPIVAMVSYTILFDIGLGIVPNLLTGEIFSASVKAKALGILIIYCALATSASSKLFQFLEESFGMHVPFFVFAFCCVSGTLFCYYYVPETKGQSLEEIQRNLKN
ncbi:hypothetical protein ILUMI_25336 [Ignelater luminosus]|uniref:Major facilitator superfamily (MFS) profile domain-containing protein n=1 Tax=Ignelater luminosus TaxID=2038154 RepID=A0A8K0C8R6_IGNLU|nr:hypothetical protein ILUMI_25336 [Ignelater luminosus]